jgi:hypothetical protein
MHCLCAVAPFWPFPKSLPHKLVAESTVGLRNRGADVMSVDCSEQKRRERWGGDSSSPFQPNPDCLGQNSPARWGPPRKEPRASGTAPWTVEGEGRRWMSAFAWLADDIMSLLASILALPPERPPGRTASPFPATVDSAIPGTGMGVGRLFQPLIPYWNTTFSRRPVSHQSCSRFAA